jgi:hypothetical protein
MESFLYNSIADYTADIQRGMAVASQHNRGVFEHYKQWTQSQSGWFGPFKSDWAAAERAITEDWPEGRETVQRLADSLRNQVALPQNVARRIRRCDQGDSLEYHDVLAGRLGTAWRKAKRDRIALAPTEIWLTCFKGMSGSQHGDILQWRGAAVTALADLLTEAGYNVGILAYADHEHPVQGMDSHVEIIVKDPLAPINMQTLVSALVNPGFHRILHFQWCCSRTNKAHDGFGAKRPHAYPDTHIQGTEELQTESDARDYLVSTLARIQGETQ